MGNLLSDAYAYAKRYNMPIDKALKIVKLFYHNNNVNYIEQALQTDLKIADNGSKKESVNKESCN